MSNEIKIPEYVVVRTFSAGAFAGELLKREGKEVWLTNARRLWYWDGAASLSELALRGVTKPQNCKFPDPVDIILTEAVEIISTTPEARACIEAVTPWRAEEVQDQEGQTVEAD